MEYPHFDKMVRMLRFLSDAETAVRNQYSIPQLQLNLHRGAHTGLKVPATQQDVGAELKISSAEAIGLLEELADDDYLNLRYGRGGFTANAGRLTVIIRQKGRAAVMDVPDPNAELLRRLEAIAVAIEGLQDVEPDNREHAAATVRELKTFGRALAPQAAIQLAKVLTAVFGVGGG